MPTEQELETFIQQCAAALIKGTPRLVVKSWCDALELNYPECDSESFYQEIQRRADGSLVESIGRVPRTRDDGAVTGVDG